MGVAPDNLMLEPRPWHASSPIRQTLEWIEREFRAINERLDALEARIERQGNQLSTLTEWSLDH